MPALPPLLLLRLPLPLPGALLPLPPLLLALPLALLGGDGPPAVLQGGEGTGGQGTTAVAPPGTSAVWKRPQELSGAADGQ